LSPAAGAAKAEHDDARFVERQAETHARGRRVRRRESRVRRTQLLERNERTDGGGAVRRHRDVAQFRDVCDVDGDAVAGRRIEGDAEQCARAGSKPRALAMQERSIVDVAQVHYSATAPA
jgi:hypothetical protein